LLPVFREPRKKSTLGRSNLGWQTVQLGHHSMRVERLALQRRQREPFFPPLLSSECRALRHFTVISAGRVWRNTPSIGEIRIDCMVHPTAHNFYQFASIPVHPKNTIPFYRARDGWRHVLLCNISPQLLLTVEATLKIATRHASCLSSKIPYRTLCDKRCSSRQRYQQHH
jgi:hypothetical protein